MHVYIFESLQLEGLYVGYLLYNFKVLKGKNVNLKFHIQRKYSSKIKITSSQGDEVKWFYEGLQEFPELTPKKKKNVLFITEDWNAKVGSQEIPGVTGKFGLGVQNEAGQKLTEFCKENTLVTANTLFQQHKR